MNFLGDDLVETIALRQLGEQAGAALTVLLKPGVMDPVAQTVLAVAHDLGLRLEAVRTFRRYWIDPDIDSATRNLLERKVLSKVWK